MGVAKVSLGAHRPAELHVQLVRIRLPLKDVPQDLGTSTAGTWHGVPWGARHVRSKPVSSETPVV